MKLEAQFTSRNNSLFFLDGSPVSLSSCPSVSADECSGSVMPQGDALVCTVTVPWSLVGMDEESYNEEFLASLRDWLKTMDDAKQYVILVPLADADLSSVEQKEALTASVKHLARRVKDCTSVVGLAVPEEFTQSDCEFFMEEISKKHAQYVYFSKNDALLTQNQAIVRY